MSEKKEYTTKELYKGYYWLVLHTDPCHAPDGKRDFSDKGGCIIPREYWREEKPDWVKTQYTGSDTHYWLAPDDIPLLKVGDTEIKSWKNMKTLWGNVSIKGVPGRFYSDAPPTPLRDVAWSYHDIKDLYEANGAEILQAIKSYLSDEHRNNLSKLEEAEKAQKTSLLIRITPTSPARVVGLLASIVTLIMFVYWLLGKL